MLLLVIVGLGAVPVRGDEATRAVQEELRRRHLFYGEIDGRESAELSAALKHYQERIGFRQTGLADAETLRSMSITKDRGAQLPDVPVLRSDRAAPAGTAPVQDGIASVASPGTWSGGALPTQMEIRTYLRDYLDASQSANAADELPFYAPQIAYYDQGVVTKTFVRNEIVAYRQHWPERRYTLADPLTVTARGDKVLVRYRVSFDLANTAVDRRASGATTNSILLARGSDDRWEITAIKEERVRTPTRRHSGRPTRDPVGRTMRKVGRSVRRLFR